MPVGVLLAVGVILSRGPKEALEAVNDIVGDIARTTIRALSALLSSRS